MQRNRVARKALQAARSDMASSRAVERKPDDGDETVVCEARDLGRKVVDRDGEEVGRDVPSQRLREVMIAVAERLVVVRPGELEAEAVERLGPGRGPRVDLGPGADLKHALEPDALVADRLVRRLVALRQFADRLEVLGTEGLAAVGHV